MFTSRPARIVVVHPTNDGLVVASAAGRHGFCGVLVLIR